MRSRRFHRSRNSSRDVHEPKGVLRKNLKPFIYLGAALLVIVAAVFSGTSKKTPTQQAAARHEPPQPTVQDNTDNNVQDLKNQLAAEQQRGGYSRPELWRPSVPATPPNRQPPQIQLDGPDRSLRSWAAMRPAKHNGQQPGGQPRFRLRSKRLATGSQRARTRLQLAICIESRIYPPAGGSGFATASGGSGGRDCGWLSQGPNP